MDDDRRDLGGLNPEPDGGAGWPGTEAGRRTRARVEARLDAATLEPAATPSSRLRLALMIGPPALVVLLAVGLPLLLLRGGEPGKPVATVATTAPTTTEAPTSTAVVGLTEWVFQGMVLDKQGVGPQLCMAVQESLPPQCQGMPVVGLDWADVTWAESAGDTTWAEARLVGHFDGQTFTLTRAPAEPEPVIYPEEDPFATPCPEPDGGWAVTDPALATQEAFEAAARYAEAQLAYSALWIDYLVEPSEEVDLGPATFVLNVRFAESLTLGDVVGPTDLAALEAALREIYGGPLCVTTGAQVTESELRSIQEQVHLGLNTPEAVAAGIYAGHGQGTGVDTLRGVVVATVFVVIDDAYAQAWLDAKWGPGLVEVSGMLQRFEEETLPLHLYVSNQTNTINPVAVRITLDGEVMVDQEFEFLDGHNWILLELQVAAGEHELRVFQPETGAEMVETFEVDGERWAVVDFFAGPEESEAPQFTWIIKDEPVGFA
jgi:hypothetical protein